MTNRGWTMGELAEGAGIGLSTVRDLIAGRRWPRVAKRNALEETLGWDTGRIAAIARGTAAAADSPAMQSIRGDGDPVRRALEQSELNETNRYTLLTIYLDLLHKQRVDNDRVG